MTRIVKSKLYHTPTTYGDKVFRESSWKGYYATRCSLCTRKPMYCWWKRAFCEIHKQEALAWTAAHPSNIDKIIMVANDKSIGSR